MFADGKVFYDRNNGRAVKGDSTCQLACLDPGTFWRR
jgi:hypothetical protein